ncbi:helix-turn-helix domain-containing protein [Pseudomonas sp. SWRI59]|uniref:XRE family transcriptional regulator n=1 Tax=unclassified Pseudomonas TaxID=196821 RepID=UPI0016465D0F|nr:MULTISPECIES: S24 family peptidase [unclassified Pseudomonas]MBC3503553.1 helix-turn-helix domain-containing protein [Pseudomonas sp. SWRI59]MBC3507476.1 helix-turn-helix domain-containing protein [Pseudomonas sp. SWRI68]
MNESLSQRIKRLRKATGMSQAQLADACGWKSQSRVGNYEAGTREPTLADIASIASALGVDQSELLLNSPPPETPSTQPRSTADLVKQMLAKSGKGIPEEARKRLLAAAEEPAPSNVIAAEFQRPGLIGDEVWIAHYDVRAAMGGGEIAHDFPEMLKDVRVSPSHLRELGVEFEEHYHLKMVTGWGQSMEPTIKHRDPLIVNINIREFVGDGIYLFHWDDHIYIKRLQVADEEHFEMISDNTRHKDRLIRRDMTYIQARVLLVWNAHLV